jgi:hypothetical protein
MPFQAVAVVEVGKIVNKILFIDEKINIFISIKKRSLYLNLSVHCERSELMGLYVPLICQPNLQLNQNI